MIFSGSLTEKKEKISNHGRKILGELSDMMLTKYFLLLCILAVMAVSIRLIDSMRSVESVIIYTAGNDVIGYRPDSLFGILGKFVRSFADWIIISDLMYITFVVIISTIVFISLKNKEDKFLKITALLACCVLVYSISNIPVDTAFSFAVSLIPILSAYLVLFTKHCWLSPMLTAVGMIIDPRGIVIIVPMAMVSYWVLKMFRERRDDKKVTLVLLLTVASSIIVLIGAEYITISNNQEIISYETEYLRNKYELYFEGTEEKYITYAINNIVEKRTTPVMLICSSFQFKNGLISDIHYYGGLSLMILAYALCIIFYRFKAILKDDIKRNFLISSTVFILYLVWLTGKSFCIVLYLLFLSTLKIYYHRKQHEKIKVQEEFWAYGCIVFAIVMRILQITTTIYPEKFSLFQYYLDYETFGFMPRLLIGSIFVKLSGGTFTADELIAVMTLIEIMIILCEALMLLKIYRGSEDKSERYMLMLLMLMYAISPASSNLTNGANNLKFDWFLIVESMVCLWALYKNNKMVFIIPVMCILAMLTHHVFVCTIFPLLFIMMIYRAIVEPGRHMIRNTVVMAVTLAVTATMFFWFNFMYEPSGNISEEYMGSIVYGRSAYTVTPHHELIHYVFLGRPADRVEFVISTYIRNNINLYISATKVVVLSIPLIVLFVYVLYMSAKQEQEGVKKFSYVFMGISLFVTLVPLFTDCDWDRWLSNFLKTIIVSLIFLTALQPQERKWYNGIEKKDFIYTVIISQSIMPSFCSMFSCFPLFMAW